MWYSPLEPLQHLNTAYPGALSGPHILLTPKCQVETLWLVLIKESHTQLVKPTPHRVLDDKERSWWKS